jgi:hypothetical protein
VDRVRQISHLYWPGISRDVRRFMYLKGDLSDDGMMGQYRMEMSTMSLDGSGHCLAPGVALSARTIVWPSVVFARKASISLTM